MTHISTTLLYDISIAGRLKYHESSYLSQATSTQLKKHIQHLVETKKITKEIIRTKNGSHYSTIFYLSIKNETSYPNTCSPQSN